jgi:hypothetical protein
MHILRLLLLETQVEKPKPNLSAFISEDRRVDHSALLIESGLFRGQIIEDGNGHPAETVSRFYESEKATGYRVAGTQG